MTRIFATMIALLIAEPALAAVIEFENGTPRVVHVWVKPRPEDAKEFLRPPTRVRAGRSVNVYIGEPSGFLMGIGLIRRSGSRSRF
jgi:hypothetical protein